MTVMKRKGRNKWHFEFQYQGQKHCRGGFDTKLEAIEAEMNHRKLLKKRSNDMALTRLAIERANWLEANATEGYYKENVKTINRFITYINGTADFVSEVSRDDVETFLNTCYRADYAWNYALRQIRAFFNHGRERDWFDHNPTKGIKFKGVDKKKKYIPPKEDLDKVIRYADWHDMIFLLTIKNTLARSNEIYNLKWEDIDFRKRTVTLWTRKKRGGAKTPRTIPMTEELYQALRTLEKGRGYVFVNPNTQERFIDKKKLLIGLCKEAKVKRFTLHAIRHYGASVLISKGVPLSDIQEILGHDNLMTTVRYIQSLGGSTTKSIHLLE